MRCPECRGDNSAVIDSRYEQLGRRRRRKCLNRKCGHRWTTIEIASRQSRASLKKELSLEYRKRLVDQATEGIVRSVETAVRRAMADLKVGEVD